MEGGKAAIRTHALLASVLFAAATVVACSGRGSSAPLELAVPTSGFGLTSANINEAITEARALFSVSPPYRIHEIESMTYVVTSMGQVRSAFDPLGQNRKEWFAESPADTRAWVISATGHFETVPSAAGDQTPRSFSSIVALVPQGLEGYIVSTTAEPFDLDQFGTPISVKMPLPEYPTPVMLDEEESAS